MSLVNVETNGYESIINIASGSGDYFSYPRGSQLDQDLYEHYTGRDDAAIGRQRVELLTGDWYVYPASEGFIRVVEEMTGESELLYSDRPPDVESFGGRAAQEWMRLNPPKEPQEGEIWDIETVSGDQWRCVVRDGCFVSVNPSSAPSYAIDGEYIVRKEFVL